MQTKMKKKKQVAMMNCLLSDEKKFKPNSLVKILFVKNPVNARLKGMIDRVLHSEQWPEGVYYYLQGAGMYIHHKQLESAELTDRARELRDRWQKLFQIFHDRDKLHEGKEVNKMIIEIKDGVKIYVEEKSVLGAMPKPTDDTKLWIKFKSDTLEFPMNSAEEVTATILRFEKECKGIFN